MNASLELRLLNYGFKDVSGGEFLSKEIHGIFDRHRTTLKIYYDDPYRVYIDRLYLRGLETMSEKDVLNSSNNVNKGATSNYSKFKILFPEIESVI